jgi:arylsulfatase A-like enzyme
MGKGPYADWVLQGDDAVGRMLDVVERMGIAKNTLIIASSDNGCAVVNDLPPLRGKKRDTWGGGVRVAFAARWPAFIQPGTTCDDPISLNSLLATCAEITGQKLPANAGEDSFSILPLLKGETKGPTHNGVIVVGVQGPAIVLGEWKYFINRKELYRTPSNADIGEKSNVADQHPKVVAELAVRYDEITKLGRSTTGEPQIQRKLGDMKKSKK